MNQVGSRLVLTEGWCQLVRKAKGLTLTFMIQDHGLQEGKTESAEHLEKGTKDELIHSLLCFWLTLIPSCFSVRPLSHCSFRWHRDLLQITEKKPPLPGWPKVIVRRMTYYCMWQNAFCLVLKINVQILTHLQFSRTIIFRFFALII